NADAQCSDRGFVTALTANGALMRTFGHKGSSLIPNGACTYIYDESVVDNPDGSLYLLGGHPDTCVPPPLVHVLPHGSLDTGFDNPATIRLPSGRILAAGYAKTQALVQAFQPDGSRDLTVGDHGQLGLTVQAECNTTPTVVALLPAAGGSAWLVTELHHEFD